MKCDHIRTREQGDTPFFPNILNNGNVEVCLKEDVDEAIAELKEENLNLKAKNIKLQSFYDLHGNVDNYIDKLKAENKRIKLSAEKVLRGLLECGLIKEWYFNGKFNAVLKADDPHLKIAELKQKLENVQASMYADVVDANMENRRLRRALYKACAEWALSTLSWLDCIDQGNPVKWGEMRRKCLEKVEEYK